MLNVTWRRFDQSAKQLIVGQTTILCDKEMLEITNEVVSQCCVTCRFDFFDFLGEVRFEQHRFETMMISGNSRYLGNRHTRTQ